MYTTVQDNVKLMFLKSLLCSPRLYLFNQTYSKNSNIVKYSCLHCHMIKVPLRQVISLGGHLWNASQPCNCSSYLFEWGDIKFSKAVHQAYN